MINWIDVMSQFTKMNSVPLTPQQRKAPPVSTACCFRLLLLHIHGLVFICALHHITCNRRTEINSEGNHRKSCLTYKFCEWVEVRASLISWFCGPSFLSILWSPSPSYKKTETVRIYWPNKITSYFYDMMILMNGKEIQ